MYTPPPPGLESTGLYDNGNAMVPLPSGVPANGEGFISTDLGKILTNKLSSYAIGAAVNFSLQNTVIELPPPFGMVFARLSADGRIVACAGGRGVKKKMFSGRVSVGVGWGEGIVEKDTVSGGGPPGASRGGGFGASYCKRCKNTLKFDPTVYSEVQAGFSLFGLGGQAVAGMEIGSYSFPNGPWRWSLKPYASVSAVDGEDLALALTVAGEASGKGQLVLP